MSASMQGGVVPAATPVFWGLTSADFAAHLRGLGEPAKHATAAYRSLFLSRGQNAQLENIPKRLQNALSCALSFSLPRIVACQVARDGTRKYALAAADEGRFEAVYIPKVTRRGTTNTLCISSQTGCSVGCTFCFTASLRRNRDLSAAEIVGQVVAVQQDIATLGQAGRITNIVFMGMGEPLLNYDNVVQALRVLMHQDGLDFSKRKVTVSTSGVVPKIDALGQDVGPLLAVSLNATTDEVRNQVIPINRKWPLEALLAAMRRYPKPRGGRITVEYVMLRDVNDSDADAHRLAELLIDIPSKINLLPLNEHDKTLFKRPSDTRVDAFQNILWKHGYSAIVRSQRGDDIAAACGQLGGHTSV